MNRVSVALLLALLAIVPSSADAAVRAGAAAVDGTYNVGNSAGQYASTRDGGLGDPDPHLQSVKNQASYGVQSRLTVRALVIKGADGKHVALLSDNHYIAQDALHRRTAQLIAQATGGAINASNLTMAVTHNHSSPSYSATAWGVWAFQDVFDYRFFDYYARQNARAILKAFKNMHDVRVSATASHFDAFQRNPMGPGRGDDRTPVGFPRSFTDHDLSVVRFENIEGRKPKPLATLVNIGMHPEFLEGYDLISGEYTETMQSIVDRKEGGVTIFTQNATGTSEVERDNWHDVNTRAIYDHAQYAQMEWGAHQLAMAVSDNVRDIEKQRANPQTTHEFGLTPYSERFVPWMSNFPVAMENRWFPGPVSHPYPGVSSCRTDAALAGHPRIPVVGLPDCTEIASLPVTPPGLSTDTLQALGVPVPENYSVPSTGALQDTAGVHMQAFRLGPILFTVCACEQWADQSFNIKTRLDDIEDNQWNGYDPTSPDADPSMKCTEDAGGETWTCTPNPGEKVPAQLIRKMQAQINNDARGWDDPKCMELGCGLQAESEPTDLSKIRGNFTHDDTTAGAYKMVVPIAMANDYYGYIASYRDYQNHDHYRKALTGFGPHSMDYLSTRLVRMGRALNGHEPSRAAVAAETELGVAPEHTPLIVKTIADQGQEEAKVRSVGEAASAATKAYAATVADDGGSEDALTQPKDIQRFDAATFTWDGGNNFTDTPRVVVQRRVKGRWVKFADQSGGELPLTLDYPDDLVASRTGGQRWRWTSSFEAFVSRFDLFDPRGKRYRATPAGEYRFVARGKWRRSGKDVAYKRVSDAFTVRPWSGLTVEEVERDGGGRVTFAAGPSRTLQELRVRKTDRPPLERNADGSEAPVTFTIGPVDYPDMARDPKATGARFLSPTRGYSAASFDEVEHYCLDCRFRDWADVAGALTATVIFADGTVEKVGSTDGRFRTDHAGTAESIVIEDEWGNTSEG